MSSAPLAAEFPLHLMRPAQACGPRLAAAFAGASLGLLLAQALLAASGWLAALENQAPFPHLLHGLAATLPRAGDGTAQVFGLVLCLLGALVAGLGAAADRPGKATAVPAAHEALRSWVRVGDLVELQFPSGAWVLVRAQVNDRQWRDVHRLLVWSRRMAHSNAT